MPRAPLPACVWESLSRAGLKLSDEHVKGGTRRSLMIISHANSIVGQGYRELHAQGLWGGSTMKESLVSEQMGSLETG